MQPTDGDMLNIIKNVSSKKPVSVCVPIINIDDEVQGKILNLMKNVFSSKPITLSYLILKFNRNDIKSNDTIRQVQATFHGR